MPRVTVVIPTRNRSELLPEAVASVRAQSFGDWECVIVDDGSSDATPRVIERLQREERRLRSLRLGSLDPGPPGPAPRALHGPVRNAAIRASSPPLLAFLDDDDLWTPDTLAIQVAALEACPDAPLVCGRIARFGEASGVWPSSPVPRRLELSMLLRGNVVPLSTVMVRREALVEAGLFPEDVEATPDYELWLRLARRRPLLALPDVLCRYRVHPGSISRRRALETAELEALYARLEREWALPARLLRPARRGLARSRARRATSWPEWLGHWRQALWP